MSESIALELRDVVFRYHENGRRNVLDHVSLMIPAGRVTVLMGRGGCGKSTLAAVAAGLYPENGGFLESGSIRLFGRPLEEMNQQERATYLTLMFQNPDLQFCMDTLRKELYFCMENLCVSPEMMDARIDRTVKRLGVAGLLDRKLHTLSGGEKQKCALACIDVMESRCILLDEAFANIDEPAARELVRLLLRLRDEGRTVVAIDHQPGYWMEADEIIVLGEGGRVLERGISPSDSDAYAPLFEREGLCYPGKRLERAKRRPESRAAVEFLGVSVPKGIPEKKRRFGKREPAELLLERADAVFPEGRMTAVLGPSGSGKTTAFLAALKQHPYEGMIRFRGRDLRKIPERELFGEVGMVFQNPANQFITQNVEDEVTAGIRLWEKALSEEDCRKRAEALLERGGLLRFRKYSPYMLSQGQQRRLAVLSVLAGGQSILFLDEPTYGQDSRSAGAIMDQLRRRTEEGMTVIFITHDRALAMAWADRIYCLEDKKLKEYPYEEE